MIAVNLQFDELVGTFYIESLIAEEFDQAVYTDNASLLPPHSYIAETLRKLYQIDYPDGYEDKADFEDVIVNININGHCSLFTCVCGVAKKIVTSAAFEPYKAIPLDSEISHILRRMVPEEIRKPTGKSLRYVSLLSSYFSVEIPDNIEIHAGKCADFIEIYHLRYLCAKYFNETKYNAKLTFRWFLAYCFYNEEVTNECIIEILSLEDQVMLDNFLENIGNWLTDFYQQPLYFKNLIIKIFRMLIEEQYPEDVEFFIKYLPSID